MKPTNRRTFLTRSAAVLGAGSLGGGGRGRPQQR